MVRLQGADLSDGDVVRHLCGNPLCVHPDHLAVGTRSENNLDTLDRGW